MTVVNNAVLTVRPGTTLRFATGAGLRVQQGALRAEGTALDPIVFTSAKDQPGQVPAPADWQGIVLDGGANASVLKHVFVRYGTGLAITNASPVIDAFTSMANAPAGLTVAGNGVINTTNALVAFNGVGLRQFGSARLGIVSSVIKNNGTNALAYGGLSLVATQNWWGTAVPAEIDATLRGAVDRAAALAGEPLLTPAIGTLNNIVQVGNQDLDLRLACRTADGMRLSEDSTFPGVFFGAFTNQTRFTLSSGGGQKSVFAQFRSVTGQTSAPVAITVNYITTGPTITAFNLAEGMVLARPSLVTGTASAPLGMAALEFYIDGMGVATNAGSSLSHWFDIRELDSGVHRVKLLARDNSGNIASRELNIAVLPTPPPAPQIVTPAADLAIGTNGLTVTGTAEPHMEVRLFRSGTLADVTNAAVNGNFSFTQVQLAEGLNQITVLASDALGSAGSATRNITLDTMAPAQLILDPPVYKPGTGLGLTWRFPVTGKRATRFQVLWSTVPINSPAQATGSTLLLANTGTTLQGLATTNYYFYVIGYDSIGNVSPLSAPAQFAYDAVPPTFNISFNKASPVGVGPMRVVLTSSEPLNGLPMVTVQPFGNAPALMPLTNAGLNIYEGQINVTTLLPSGPVKFTVSAVDVAGNPFNGQPAGPAMVIDVTPPAGLLSTAPTAPIQVTNPVNVSINLQLTEAPQGGTTPELTFNPPIGSPQPVTLSGSGSNWHGTLQLTPGMGSGNAGFSLTVADSLGNVGHLLTSGSTIELYNTALPSAPGQPVGFQAASLSGGRVQLNWLPVPNAEMYRVYSETGAVFTVPPILVADNIVSNSYVDLPPIDGHYRYVVAASRRGAEGTNSIVRIAVSDRTPPSAPTNVVVQLAAHGLQITWEPGSGPAADHYNVYRNGTLIRRVNSVGPVLDNPPRGIMSYTVAAVDALGNEALSAPVTFQLLVGAVENLQALLVAAQGPALTWSSSDPTAVGYNVYRNGIKQNTAVLTNSGSYTDSLPRELTPVTYAVRAVNSTNAESAARSVTVYPVALAMQVNSGAAPTRSYFDSYLVTVSNQATATFPLQQLEIQRTAPGATPLNIVNVADRSIAADSAYSTNFAVPCATNASLQVLRIRAVQQSDVAGSTVVYQQTVTLQESQNPGLMLEISANQLPLAGGLTPFNVRIYNRGYAPIYFATTRGNGAAPGDVYISVKNPQGQEVSRTGFNGTPPGVLFSGDVGYLSVPQGGSTSFTVPGVLVPEALASNTVAFEAVVSALYDRVSANGQQASGPIFGSMQSSLSQTPYFGTAQTDFPLYGNNQPVIISGQAVNRATGLPQANASLRIGFASRGHRWYTPVTTDANGDYSYTFNVTPGLAGSLSIWAAHPEVSDQLNQAQISIYRTYITPQAGDIRMSVNGTLPFNISILNPGDQPLTDFEVAFQAYQMQGTNRVPITSLHGTSLSEPNFSLAAGARRTVTLELNADANAPSNAVVEFTLTAAQGAKATFLGSVTLLPAFPVLTVAQPEMGYVEVSLNRGALLSKQVTVVNKGLQDLQGVSILPPTNVNWMLLNLPKSSDGSIPLPDIPVGESNSFTVVFTPPANTALGFFQDKLVIQGTNSQSTFDVRLYARVTSASRGAVQFYVDDILGADVPNASVRLRNTALQVELPPALTDINGLVTVTNLQEGDWSWQITAPGYSSTVGMVTVVPDQIVNVASRLNKSVVTINFSVVPVPYTDRYEIQIEQTFETHVPLPVLVLTPTYRQFENVTPGFQASFIVTAKNAGLIQMENLRITGEHTAHASFLPLIDYIPVLLPQQSIEIPFTVNYWGETGPVQQENPLTKCLPNPSEVGGVEGDIAGFIDGIRALANAEARCIKDNSALVIAGGVALGMKLFQDLSGLVAGVSEQIANYIGCVIGTLLSKLGDTGGSGSGPSQSSTQDFQPVGNGCFTPETQVLLVNGRSKPIDQLQVGDRVRSGEREDAISTVTEIYRLPAAQCREIRFTRPGWKEAQALRATPEHLLWVDGRGWIAAGRLQTGDALLDSSGRRCEILSNTLLTDPSEVLTVKLHGDVALYANGVLVHDLCGPLPEPSASAEQSGAAQLSTSALK
ncbi:MAG TPA: polymorphic toxin-type HINT domain-containing protein [Clostridia bacterium]|nr:polymorphic toxin-type HINT domain-containing protein [Clostridia bacterium]